MQKSDYRPLYLLLTEEKDELYTRRQNYLNNFVKPILRVVLICFRASLVTGPLRGHEESSRISFYAKTSIALEFFTLQLGCCP